MHMSSQACIWTMNLNPNYIQHNYCVIYIGYRTHERTNDNFEIKALLRKMDSYGSKIIDVLEIDQPHISVLL